MLSCVECKCVSDAGRGWIAQVAEGLEHDEDAEVVAYCPPCAEREFEFTPRSVMPYT